MSRVYICHTYYHVYISVLRELTIERNNDRDVTLILSTMSNDFGSLKDRAMASGIFKDVYMFDEKEDVTSDEVMRYHQDKGSLVKNLLQRIKYTKLLGKLQEEHVPVDLKKYDDVYLFCDSDPIGYYLNYKHIKYHSMEDGRDSILLDDQARNSNKGAFKLKCFMSKLGLIFIENGYSRYCIDFVVNDLKANPNPPKNIREESADDMFRRLKDEDHKRIVGIFLDDPNPLCSLLDVSNYDKPCVMILTEPLCELDIRKRLFSDIINEHNDEYTVIIKPHPRDILDYEKEFPDTIVIREKFPMEIMNNIPGLHVKKLISVITQVTGIFFADEVVFLGLDFLDKYEDPAIHRQDLR